MDALGASGARPYLLPKQGLHTASRRVAVEAVRETERTGWSLKWRAASGAWRPSRSTSLASARRE